ncbi:MAG TPA: hypothetical protein VFO39_20870 [Candidatus Sulfotelmatobacter sp.]|nr:hypothetical protein [Candidatus Sulfotelmatobacter sp.]
MSSPTNPLRQLITVGYLRWRMFVNGLRTRRGKTEMVARSVVGFAFGVGALLGAIFTGVGSWYFVSQAKAEYLAAIFWGVFLFWQMFPVMATAFTNNPDASDLLRYPLSYRSYYFVRLAYSAFDPATALGSTWLFGMFLGIVAARPFLLPWAFAVLFTFGAFNLLLMQMIFAWVERWLAQRRTREIMGVLFILLMLSFQLVGPVMERYGQRARPVIQRVTHIFAPVQAILPPGLAGNAITYATRGKFPDAVTSQLALMAVALLMGFLLHLRLHAQFRGESLSESAVPASAEIARAPYVGWHVPGLQSPVTAVLEKELRYVARSGPMLLTLIMPIFMVAVFRVGGLNRTMGSFATRVPSMAFPMAAGYALLVLTNLVYNNFGGDAGGIQFFYASPVRFSQIVMAKNLTHVVVLLANTTLAWAAVAMLYGTPSVSVTIATAAALLFAAPMNFTVGNLLSVYSPKKLDFSTFGRQRAAQTTVLASVGVQFVMIGGVVGAFWLSRTYGSLWIATAIFLGLSAITLSVYVFALRRMDDLALKRRETLVAELART